MGVISHIYLLILTIKIIIMYADDGTELGPRSTLEVYRAEGEQLRKNGEYMKAIASFTTALELQAGDQ